MFSLSKKRDISVLALLILPILVLSIALFSSPKSALGYWDTYVNPDFENNVFKFETTTENWKAKPGGSTTDFKLVSGPPVLDGLLDYDNIDVTWYLYDADDIKLGADIHPKMLPGGVYEGRITIRMKPEMYEKDWAFRIMRDNAPNVNTAFINGNRHIISYTDSGSAEDEIPYFTISARYKVPGDVVGTKIWKYNQSGLDIGKRHFMLTHEGAGISIPPTISYWSGKEIDSYITTRKDIPPKSYTEKLLRRNHNTLSGPSTDRYKKYHVARSNALAVTERTHLQDTSLDVPDKLTLQHYNNFHHIPFLKNEETSEYYFVKNFKSRQAINSYQREWYSYAYNRMIMKGWAVPEPGYVWDFDGPPTVHVNNFPGDYWMWSENPYGKAHWEFAYKDHGGKNVIVKFDSQGGSPVDSMQMKSTNTFAQEGNLPIPTKKYFKFKYWKGGYGPNAKIVVNGDAPGHLETDKLAQTLVAQWEPAGEIDAKITWRLPNEASGDKVIYVENTKIGALAQYPPDTSHNDIVVNGVPQYVAGWKFDKGFEEADYDYMVVDKDAAATAILKPKTKITQRVLGQPDEVYYVAPYESYWVPDFLVNYPAMNYTLEGWNWSVKQDGDWFKKQPNHWKYPEDKVTEGEMLFEADLKVHGYDVWIKRDTPENPSAIINWAKDTDEVDELIQNVPEKEGFVFSHYDLYADKNFDGELTDDEKIGSNLYIDREELPDSDLYGLNQDYTLVFVAHYKKADVKVTYKYGGLENTQEEVVTYKNAGGSVIGDRIKAGPSISGFEFLEWVDAKTGKTFDKDTYLDKQAYVVEAVMVKVEPPYPLEFIFYDGSDANGGNEVSRITVSSDEMISPPAVTWDGHFFSYWKLKDSNPLVQIAKFENVKAKNIFSDRTLEEMDSPIKLVAVWDIPQESGALPYSIIIDTAGGTPIDKFTVPCSGEYGSPASEDFTLSSAFGSPIFGKTQKPGHVLEGFLLNGKLIKETDYYTIPKEDITSDIVLTAKWKQTAPDVTITFKPENGEENTSITQAPGLLVELPEVAKDGYEFLGWFNEANDYKWDTGDVANTDITLIAKWRKGPERIVPPITITYNVDGGTPEIDDVITKAGLTAPRPGPVEKEGFICEGWKNIKDGKAWDFATPVEKDLDLQAIWTPTALDGRPAVTVSFDTQGGAPELEDILVPRGSKLNHPTLITKDGEHFVGWFNEDTEWNFETDLVEEDITLTAKWSDIDPKEDTTYERDDARLQAYLEKNAEAEVSEKDITLHNDPLDNSVTGHVFMDTNENKVLDEGEKDINGVRVLIVEEDFKTVVAETTTESPYTFKDVDPGVYIIKVDESTIPSGLVPTVHEQGVKITVNPEGDVIGPNFGFVKKSSGKALNKVQAKPDKVVPKTSDTLGGTVLALGGFALLLTGSYLVFRKKIMN